ncbi:MAG: HD domain-containing phosphohydrolase, partial [Oscillospiraceae bacterium]
GGVCVYPYAASTVTQLVGNADMAVYNAKRSGKNKILAYSMDAPHTTTDGGEVGSQPGYSDYASTIYALTAAIDAKDHYTFNHSQNVARYATALGAAIGLNEEHIKILNEAALLHDIGKIGIPEQILTKPDPLTDEESRIMQTHVENSISIIRHLPSLDYVIPTAIGHHERWDGTGYPRGISGEDIPLGARCLAIADTFDAMTSNRPYRKALPVETALTEIASMAGSQFDPRLVPVFLDLVRREGFASEHAAPQTVCG